MRASVRAPRAVVVGSVLASLVIAAIAGAASVRAGNGQPDNQSSSRITYAIIGDTPYGAPQLANFPNDVAQINADPKVRLVMHLGDIKNGSSVCSDSYFQTIATDFAGFEDPLVYTPGDNEWTDCHRANNGGYTPTERLAKIRSLFFPNPGWSLGQTAKALDAQDAPYVENVRWSQSNVGFGMVDVPGSNNDQLLWFDPTQTSNPADDPPRTQDQIDEVTNRIAADNEWLDHIFDSAEAHDAPAIVIGIQADMWDPAFSGANDQPLSYDHFEAFVQELAARTLEFGKPVLLLNGDSHIFVDDFPLSADAPAYQRTMYGVNQAVPNLHRVTVNGSTTPCHEYLRLTIDPRSTGIFNVERVLFHNQPGFDPSVCPPT
jgi:hypothetical protein